LNGGLQLELLTEETIAMRCSKALEECKEYMECEYNETLPQDELQAMAEKICYKNGYAKGFADAMAINKYSQFI
jgi:hypothetical protein